MLALSVLFLNAVKGQLNANFSANITSGCTPITVQFTDNSSGSPTAWKWELGNGISTQQNPAAIYITPGIYTIKLTVYKGTDSSTVTKTGFITVYAIPTVNFTGTPTSGCFPLPVNFTESSTAGSGTITAWQYDFGDGNIGNQQNPSHTYNNTGLFNVSLTVVNSNGCRRTLTKPNYIQINDGVKANFSFDLPPGCTVPATVNFTNSSTGNGINTWFWEFGDGATATGPGPLSHTYTTAGNYPVKLTVSNPSGCSNTFTYPGGINIGTIKADFSFPNPVCAGARTTFVNTTNPATAGTTYLWEFSDGTQSTAIHPVKIFAAAGTYTVKLTSTSGTCTHSETKTITVLSGAGGDFTSTSNLASCKPPLTVNFTNTSTGGTVIRWIFGDGDSSVAVNPVHTYTSFGNFTVTLVIRSANGCIQRVVKPGFVRIAPPEITSIQNLPYEGCIPWTNTFQANIVTPDPIVKYEWDLGDGTLSQLATPSHTYNVEGIFIVKLKITTAVGCTDTISSWVMVGHKPVPNFSANPRNVCAEFKINFTDLSTNGPITEWHWDFGDGGTSTDPNPIYKYTDTGYFTVTLTVKNFGCMERIVFPRYIYITPPIALFKDSFVCGNQFQRFFRDESIADSILSWRWAFGDGDTAITQHTSHLYADTGRYSVKLNIVDKVCKDDITVDILVLDEKADFTRTDSVSCKSSTIFFKAEGPKTHPWNIKRYLWDFGDGTPVLNDSVRSTARHVYTAAGTYQVKLRITDMNGCVDSIIKPLVVGLYGPKADFGPDSMIVCVNTPFVFSDSSKADQSNGITKWIFDFGDSTSNTFTAPPFAHTYATGGNYDVTLVVEDARGCRDTITKPGFVQVSQPKADFFISDTMVCLNTQIWFKQTVTSSVYVTDYFFDLGDGFTTNDGSVYHTYASQGVYNVKLAIKDANGCRDSIVKPVRIVNAKANFAMSDSFTTCPPLLVSFANQSLNNASSSWDFGNGNTSQLINPSHTYTFSGVFNVKLTVTGVGGCRDSTIRQVKILGPNGVLSYSPIRGCVPLQAALNVSYLPNSSPAKFFSWDYNDGVTAFGSSQNTSHTYNALGDYVPKVILEDSLGCRVGIEGPDTIRVKGIEARIKAIPTYLFCDSTTVQFSDSTITNDTISSRFWDFGDGNSSQLQNPVHKYSQPGVYRVVYRAETITGCISSDTLAPLIKIVPSPILDFTGDSLLCRPAVANFRGLWNNADTSTMRWAWDFGNGDTSMRQNPPSQNYPQAGTFNVVFTGKSASGCVDTVVKKIKVVDKPTIVAAGAPVICRDRNTTLTASGGRTYVWDASSTLSCLNCPNPIAQPDTNTIYRVTGTDSNGCVNTDTVLIRVQQRFRVTVGGGDTLCLGEFARLTATGAENYTWTPPLNMSNPGSGFTTVRPDSTTTYMLVGYDNNNCFYDTGYIRIVVYPIPNVDILREQIQITIGDTVHLTSTSSADVTAWRWTPSAGLSCATCPSPIAKPTRQSSTYELLVTNGGGCIARDQVTIVTICNGGNIFIPNTFSPNGDGMNDVFYPRGKGVYGIKAMRIFSRWGELLYERTNFVPNDVTAGWNGTYQGKKLTPDVYVYVIDIVCDNDYVFSAKGNVTLLK